jgi:hypothetical protein
MVLPSPLLIASIFLTGIAVTETAHARWSYCCNDANGKLVCGDILPTACQNRAYRIKDEKGRLVREVEAPLTPEQRAAREAAKAKQLEEQQRLAEQRRQDQAMLATYSSEQAIDAARDRVLADFDKASGDIRKRHEAATKRKKTLDGEKEFYQKKPMPANLKKQVDDTDAELKLLDEAVAHRARDRDTINTKFAEEKKRYADLRSGKVKR